MNIKVLVKTERKCAASLDWKRGKVWVLSFGDLDRPDTDVEVEFTPAQLNELEVVVRNAQNSYKQMIKDAEREKKQIEGARAKAKKIPEVRHYGNC